MRYVVIGAGAVGGVIGGLLAVAGKDVVMIARGAHGAAIRSDGLLLRLPTQDLRPPVNVATSLDDIALHPDDVILVAVKSHQTHAVLDEVAAQSIGGAPAGSVLPLFCVQNGIANEDAAMRGVRSVHGVCVNLAATHLEPGVVDGEGTPFPGVLDVGLAVGGYDAVDEAVAVDLAAAGFVASVRRDVMAWKRAKLLRNLGNASQALFGSPEDPDEVGAAGRLRSAALAEGRAVFSAAGMTVVDDERWDEHLAGRKSLAAVHGQERRGGSTWQSLQRGADGVETNYLNGEIVRLGRWAGILTPANEALVGAMIMLVQGRGMAGSILPSTVEASLLE